MLRIPRIRARIVTRSGDLRLGTVADLPALRFVDPLMRADPDRARLVRLTVEKGDCWVAVDQAEVLGFLIMGELLGHRFIPLLVVAAGDRRRGIGTSLLTRAIVVCTRPKLFISCNRSNLPAQALFEKCGFVPSGRLSNLDADDDELFFVRFVSAAGVDPAGEIKFRQLWSGSRIQELPAFGSNAIELDEVDGQEVRVLFWTRPKSVGGGYRSINP